MTGILESLDAFVGDGPFACGPVTWDALRRATAAYCMRIVAGDEVRYSLSYRGREFYCKLDAPEVLCDETERAIAEKELAAVA